MAKKSVAKKPAFGSRKNGARKVFPKFTKTDDRPGFIAAVIKLGATDGTARVWWQQFRSNPARAKIAA